MGEINILILSAGRRVELIECFRAASKEYGVKSKIITTDISKTAPATYFSDVNYTVPKINESGFIESIINICLKEKVKMIVPTIDTELLLLSKNKDKIEKTGAKVLISDKKVIDICRNKVNTSIFFEKNNFLSPKVIDRKNINEKKYKFPLFIKPYDGSSSVNAFKVNNEYELKFFLEYIKNPIVQEFIEGKEYTIDAFMDFDGNPINIVPRERLCTRAGEVLKGKVIKDRDLIDETKRLLNVLKPIGPITIQCIKNKKGIIFIEINPRFGGGVPMSIKAGANSPLNLYRLLNNEKLSYSEDYMDNLVSLRFDSDIFLDEKGDLI